jgi:succinate dehydrogenase/fumarate reductase flavoprotein subunit
MHMSKAPHRLVVVGHGAAGLSAALTAVETVRRHHFLVDVALVEKAPGESAGGSENGR